MIHWRVCLRIVLISLGLLAAQPGYAASFDCGKAKSKVEQAVCADSALSDLDLQLAQVYSSFKSATALFPHLQRDQSKWLASLSVGGNLHQDYALRLASLKGLRSTYRCVNNAENSRTLRQCVDDADDRTEDCIDQEGGSTRAMVLCTTESAQIWQILLDYSLAVAKKEAAEDKELLSAIEKSHASWLRFKDDECKMEWTKVRTGTLRGPVAVGCQLHFLQKRVQTYLMMYEP